MNIINKEINESINEFWSCWRKNYDKVTDEEIDRCMELYEKLEKEEIDVSGEEESYIMQVINFREDIEEMSRNG
jgi:hypothetical protein